VGEEMVGLGVVGQLVVVGDGGCSEACWWLDQRSRLEKCAN
jgi:hypothetical protein